MLPLGVGIWRQRSSGVRQGRPVREKDVSGHEGMNGSRARRGEDMDDLYRMGDVK